jgi:hypothetical protein
VNSYIIKSCDQSWGDSDNEQQKVASCRCLAELRGLGLAPATDTTQKQHSAAGASPRPRSSARHTELVARSRCHCCLSFPPQNGCRTSGDLQRLFRAKLAAISSLQTIMSKLSKATRNELLQFVKTIIPPLDESFHKGQGRDNCCRTPTSTDQLVESPSSVAAKSKSISIIGRSVQV